MSTEQNVASNKQENRDINSKRNDFLDWQEYFMSVAFLVAKRSKDPCSQVGACIVNKDMKIVGTGFNEMPKGNDDDFSWSKQFANKLQRKKLYVCHAEMNAIMNKYSADVKDCTIYVGLFPCNECAKIIVQSGISKVIYLSDKHEQKVKTKAAKRIFDASSVKYTQYIPKNQKIVIDFTEINWDDQKQLPSTSAKRRISDC